MNDEAVRVVIAGGPKVGKTTCAGRLGEERKAKVRHTDDLISRKDWSAQSEEVASWFGEPGPWIVEGVATPRALRKWLKANRTGKPCDVVYWGEDPKVSRDRFQDAMAAGCLTVWREVEPELRKRGVVIVYGLPE